MRRRTGHYSQSEVAELLRHGLESAAGFADADPQSLGTLQPDRQGGYEVMDPGTEERYDQLVATTLPGAPEEGDAEHRRVVFLDATALTLPLTRT